MHEKLTKDTKAILLLCSTLGKATNTKPLTQAEYARLAGWLQKMNMRPSNLLQQDNTTDAAAGADIEHLRLTSLLGRGVQLGFKVEEWQRYGIWIICRSDADYPIIYKKRLKQHSPPLLYGIGERSLLTNGGLAIVGSRNIDENATVFTDNIARLCAHNKITVISGGARGVDQTAMQAAVLAGGNVINVLAENLLKKSIETETRRALADGQLLCLSPFHPESRFTVFNAMGRNKLIYALANYGLVVSTEYKKGGTWAGAEEILKKYKAPPLFVRMGCNAPESNAKLTALGAIPFPDDINNDNLQQQLSDLSSGYLPHQQSNLDLFGQQETVASEQPDKQYRE